MNILIFTTYVAFIVAILAAFIISLIYHLVIIPRKINQAELAKRKTWSTESLNDIQIDMYDIIRRLHARAGRADDEFDKIESKMGTTKLAQEMEEVERDRSASIAKKSTEAAEVLEKLFP